MTLIYFLIELGILFLFSQQVTKLLSLFFFHLTKNQWMGVYLLSIIFLPGVIIHELAHFLVAGIFFVPVGRMEFLPKIMGSNVKLGSVMIGKTDPVRRFLIGIAPLLVGVGIISLAFFYLYPFSWSENWGKGILLLYILFEIGNTMFSSKKDLEGTFLLAIIVFCGGITLLFAGVPLLHMLMELLRTSFMQSFFNSMNSFLCIVIIIDGLIYLSLSILLHRLKR